MHPLLTDWQAACILLMVAITVTNYLYERKNRR